MYLVCVFKWLFIIYLQHDDYTGKLGRALYRRAHLGAHAPGWSCRLVNHLNCNINMLRHLSIVVNVHLPKDRISMAHQGYGFCEFLTEEDAEYACKIMNQIKLWGKPIRVNKVRLIMLSTVCMDV